MSRSILGSLCLVRLKLLVITINVQVKLGWNYWSSILVRSDVWWHRLKSLYPKQNTSYAGLGSSQLKPFKSHQPMKLCPSSGRPVCKAAWMRGCSTESSKGAKMTSLKHRLERSGRWAMKNLMRTFHAFIHVTEENRDEETHSRWVLMICWTTCRRNAFCQRTHRGAILTSVKWYAPTSKTGSTAMGDLQCVLVHLCCRDLPTSTPFRSFF